MPSNVLEKAFEDTKGNLKLAKVQNISLDRCLKNNTLSYKQQYYRTIANLQRSCRRIESEIHKIRQVNSLELSDLLEIQNQRRSEEKKEMMAIAFRYLSAQVKRRERQVMTMDKDKQKYSHSLSYKLGTKVSTPDHFQFIKKKFPEVAETKKYSECLDKHCIAGLKFTWLDRNANRLVTKKGRFPMQPRKHSSKSKRQIKSNTNTIQENLNPQPKIIDNVNITPSENIPESSRATNFRFTTNKAEAHQQSINKKDQLSINISVKPPELTNKQINLSNPDPTQSTNYIRSKIYKSTTDNIDLRQSDINLFGENTQSRISNNEMAILSRHSSTSRLTLRKTLIEMQEVNETKNKSKRHNAMNNICDSLQPIKTSKLSFEEIIQLLTEKKIYNYQKSNIIC